MASRICSVEGCHRTHEARGYCHMHYRRWRKINPQLVGNWRRAAKDRFWEKVAIGIPAICWNWRGTTQKTGYGRFKFNGRDQLAHRVSYQLTYGPVPGGLNVLHRCDNRSCVNPDHLFIGTQSDNMKDAFAKDRITRRGEHNSRARLQPAHVLRIRSISAEGKLMQKDIAPLFGLTVAYVGEIIRREAWSHLEPVWPQPIQKSFEEFLAQEEGQ